MQEGSRKAIVAAFLANLGISIAKFVGFGLTGAASLLAEAVHSVADTGNQGLLLLGTSLARREPTTAHPFGYGRERYFWSFIVALMLFSLGGLFAIYEGVEKLRHPHELESPLIAITILVLAIVLESFSLRTAVHETNRVRAGQSWWAFIRFSKSPELPVVLLEDLGALLGLVVALLGVFMAELTGAPRWDAAGSHAIGILLVFIAITLAVEMKSLLIGEAASPRHLELIREAIEGSPGVMRLIHVRTQHIGPEELLVGAKVELESSLTFPDVAATINDVERRVRSAVPEARVLYVEPDVSTAQRT